MKATEAQREEIKSLVAELSSKKGLVNLLSKARTMLYGQETKPVKLKLLTYYANPTICPRRYRKSTIPKKSGGVRTIHAPVKGLKAILQPLNFVLQCMHTPHCAATGFVQGRSIVDNARKHVGQNYVLNLDLKDFFHSFNRNRVKLGFMFGPLQLNGSKEPLAFLLASLCTQPLYENGDIKVGHRPPSRFVGESIFMSEDDPNYELIMQILQENEVINSKRRVKLRIARGAVKTVLPQGSPTSPTITNMLCEKLDRRLTGLGNRFGATYSRYADDITFSSLHNIYNQDEFNDELVRIIEEDQGFKINPKKTRLQRRGYCQEVTGLSVSEKVNVRRRYVKQLRMWLYYWEKYGIEKAEDIFARDYVGDKGHVKMHVPEMSRVIGGKLEFLRMVKGETDSTYLGLKDRYEKLMLPLDPLTKILDLWEEKGIDAAMNAYYGEEVTEE
ncbi:reverse transcriptase family protein [Neolewinella antarctica]|uniref:RNA-directed DNA polymerase n=1 Tax=Neolewinella antarctica TaxID=442734 RepID=A0ABX0XCL5_9BACT|nr:reverse transcriptase family protein [Neolewinella antarctica]NJC27024.1 hypothetical protein [Neolewinella antarctica]